MKNLWDKRICYFVTGRYVRLTETKNKYIKEEKIVLYDITKIEEQRKF